MTRHETEIVVANKAFYTAFAQADVAGMATIWSDKPDISVIHPGHGLLKGHDAVMSSWNNILSAQQTFDISFCNAEVFQQDDIAYVVCNELLPGHTLIATNIFRHEADHWKLIHHQAGLSPELGQDEVSPYIH